MMHIRITRAVSAVVAVVMLAAIAVAAQQPGHDETPRESWQRVADVFRELGAEPGAHVADIGAGNGFFTTRLAKAVGETGRVYAVDVNPVSIRELKEALGEDITNVEVIRGEEDNPGLPAATLDGVLVVNAYHEFAEHGAMLGHIRAALKPGGRLMLIEPIPRRSEDTTRQAQTKRHTIAIEFVEEDLARAGFEIVRKDTGFVTRPGHQRDAARQTDTIRPTDWLLVARPRVGNPPF